MFHSTIFIKARWSGLQATYWYQEILCTRTWSKRDCLWSATCLDNWFLSIWAGSVSEITSTSCMYCLSERERKKEMGKWKATTLGLEWHVLWRWVYITLEKREGEIKSWTLINYFFLLSLLLRTDQGGQTTYLDHVCMDSVKSVIPLVSIYAMLEASGLADLILLQKIIDY